MQESLAFQGGHNWSLLAMAGLVCIHASLTAITLFHRARLKRGSARVLWVIITGVTAGGGIWATHIILTLPSASSYDVGLTILSLATGLIVTTLGFALSIFGPVPWNVPLGGAIVGTSIAGTTWLGMAALSVPGQAFPRLDFLFTSFALAILFGTASLTTAVRGRSSSTTLGAAILLVLAICANQAVAMEAFKTALDGVQRVGTLSLSSTSFALLIACASVAVLEMSLVSAFVDRRSEAAVKEQARQLDMAIKHMSQGLIMFNSARRMTICNNRYLHMYGLSSDIVRPGCTLRELLAHRAATGTLSADPEQYSQQLMAALATGKASEQIVELGNGRTIAIVNHPMAGGGWVATHEDISERKRVEKRIAYMAHHDMLTELPNRSAFAEHLMGTVETAGKARDSFAVLCVDIDRFKEINDVFGHAVGDMVLLDASRRLRSACEGAFVARLGGDEFAFVVTGGEQPATAEALAGRLQEAALDEFEVDGHRLRVNFSIGVAIYPADGSDPTTLLANADAALYRAKAEGRGAVRFFEADMDRRLRERRALQHDLRRAIDCGELSLHYQPQARIDGSISGFEALLRWTHPKRGVVPPATFIPLAEEDGTILDISEWVLRTACREAASWSRRLQVAVNLSPVQFRHGNLPGMVHGVLLETGLEPSRLELEITEGVLIDDFSRAVSILRRLKSLGVRIAMDDFGTGYSSLSYLQAFPFDKIKIDKSFISNLRRNPQSAAIVRAVIGLGRGLNLPVAAEGVETNDQLAFLSEECCDEIQGFLIGRPEAIDSYAELVGRVALNESSVSIA